MHQPAGAPKGAQQGAIAAAEAMLTKQGFTPEQIANMGTDKVLQLLKANDPKNRRPFFSRITLKKATKANIVKQAAAGATT